MANDRFRVTYRLTGDAQQAYAKAKDICIEQTVEFPEELLPAAIVDNGIVGNIESFTPGHECCYAVISYAQQTAAAELTQLLNVIFGNISIKPGIRVEQLELSEPLLALFKGPRFGKDGLRAYLNVAGRPLLFTALKPMGLSAKQLSALAYKMAIGGIDIIKDDHGLTNQTFAPFSERVKQCAHAVQTANAETGCKSMFVANVTAPAHQILERAYEAKALGAGGIMVAPALTGFDVMRQLADDDNLGLPVFTHPAFQGAYAISPDHGIAHGVLFGQLVRLAGADASIYPNFGGRFSFSRAQCQSIAAAATVPMGAIKPILPSPGGGMTLDVIAEMMAVYGSDVIFLMGGGLFKHSSDIVHNCRYFRELVEKFN